MTQIEKFFEAEDAIEPDFAGTELSDDEKSAGDHRGWVGGHWDNHGQHQLDYLIGQGLRPDHRFLDVGCGSFRAGRALVDYLEPGNYYGIDVNQSVMQAGYDLELTDAQRAKLPAANLRATDRFAVDFGVKFDMAIAQSVFTHIDLNRIRLCMYRVSNAMADGGRFYATYFIAPDKRPLDKIHRTPKGKPKFQERNCFWYYRADTKWVAKAGQWDTNYIGDWGQQANQKMVEYTRQSNAF